MSAQRLAFGRHSNSQPRSTKARFKRLDEPTISRRHPPHRAGLHVWQQSGLLSCSQFRELACGIETRQAFPGKPVVDGFDQNVLHVPVVLDRIHIELLDRFRLKPSDSRPFPPSGRRTVSLDRRARPRPGFRFDNGWRGMRRWLNHRRRRPTIQAWTDRHFRPPSCGSPAGRSACLLACRQEEMSSAASSLRRQRQTARIPPRSAHRSCNAEKPPAAG